MATYNKFQPFIEAVMEKKHDLGADTLKVALCNAANAPVATNATLSNLTTVALTNLASDTLTTSSSSQTSGTYSLVLADKTLTASGGAIPTFRYIVIYNDTATNDDLICWYDYGSNVELADGESLTIDFGASLFTAS